MKKKDLIAKVALLGPDPLVMLTKLQVFLTPENYTPDYWAVTIEGNKTDPWDDAAVRFSLLGAAFKVNYTGTMKHLNVAAINRWGTRLEHDQVISFEDASDLVADAIIEAKADAARLAEIERLRPPSLEEAKRRFAEKEAANA